MGVKRSARCCICLGQRIQDGGVHLTIFLLNLRILDNIIHYKLPLKRRHNILFKLKTALFT